MIRQVIVPLQNSITINFPNEFIGQTIEILAFSLSDSLPFVDNPNLAQKPSGNLESALSTLRVSLKNFKFDRNLANDYE